MVGIYLNWNNEIDTSDITLQIGTEDIKDPGEN